MNIKMPRALSFGLIRGKSRPRLGDMLV